MGPGWEPADKGLDIWQLEPSQEGNLLLCYDLMASTHKCKKPASFILHAGSPEWSALPLPKPSLGILAWLLLYARIPQPLKPTHLTTNRESSIMKHQPVSASLTTQSYQGQGLAEQYVSARTQLNPYFEPQSQETYSFPISFWRGGWGEECSGLASRYHHVLCCTARHLHLDDPSSQIRVAAPLYP